MTEFDGHRVYTLAEMEEVSGLSTSSLEKFYRARADNGHPDYIGRVGRNLVWDADEWDAWNTRRKEAAAEAEAALASMIGFPQIAEKYGISEREAKTLWDLHEHNGHPLPDAVRARIHLWKPERIDAFYTNRPKDTGPLGRGGNPEDRITLTEAARVMGVEPKSITNYPKRPPGGWPDPIEEELSPGGMTIRRYRRGDIWDYMDGGPPARTGRPVGAIEGKDYMYQGDERLNQARTALQETPESQHSELPRRLADKYGGTPGTWSHILTTARYVRD